MKTSVGIVLTIVLALATVSSAQDVGLFNGNGVSNPFGKKQSDSDSNSKNVIGMNAKSVLGSNRSAFSDEESRWKIPKLDFSKLKPKFMQNDVYPKPLEFSDSKSNLFSMPKLEWPTRDPAQPNFFQRMNERTKEMFGKTRDGFSNLGDRSRATWDSITRGVTGGQSSFGSSSNAPPAQPKQLMRSARTSDGSTSKF